MQAYRIFILRSEKWEIQCFINFNIFTNFHDEFNKYNYSINIPNRFNITARHQEMNFLINFLLRSLNKKKLSGFPLCLQNANEEFVETNKQWKMLKKCVLKVTVKHFPRVVVNWTCNKISIYSVERMPIVLPYTPDVCMWSTVVWRKKMFDRMQLNSLRARDKS